MSAIEVVDRGGQEIVVFLSGQIDAAIDEQLRDAVDRVARLERIGGLRHAVVDMHQVTGLADAGVNFLRELIRRGQSSGFEVSFSSMTGPAHRAVEAAGWKFFEGSPPLP